MDVAAAAVLFDRERAEGRAIEQWAADVVAVARRAGRIEAERAPDEPGGERAGVVVAGKTVGRVAKFFAQRAHELLRAPGLPRHMCEEIGMREIGLVAEIEFLRVEKRLQIVDETRLPERTDERIDVV